MNYDTLVGIGADGLPSKETGLAQGWELSPDQKTWTFHLRPGVKWQDGQPLTARDVAWTFNTIIDNDLSPAVYLKNVTKAVAVDDTTLKVYCSQPKANMLTTQIYLYVLPEHIWGKLSAKELGNTFRNPAPIVGSGPFQTVEFKKDQYVKMVRNPAYWGTQPTVDEIVFEYYTNTDTMVQDLKSGTIDGAQVIPPEQFKRLEGEPGIKPIAYPLYNWEYIDVNCYDSPDSLGNPVLTDPKFRVAMAWAIDREKCAVLGWSGYAQAGYGIFPTEGLAGERRSLLPARRGGHHRLRPREGQAAHGRGRLQGHRRRRHPRGPKQRQAHQAAAVGPRHLAREPGAGQAHRGLAQGASGSTSTTPSSTRARWATASGTTRATPTRPTTISRSGTSWATSTPATRPPASRPTRSRTTTR